MRHKLQSALFAGVLASISTSALAAPPAKSGAPAVPASITYSVSIADRPIDAEGEYAIKRNGVVSADLVDLTRAVGGIIMYRNANGAEVEVNHKRLTFTTNSTTAMLDGVPITIMAAPFLHFGQLFVPLRTLALTAGFSVQVDNAHAHISLGLPPISATPPPAITTVSVVSSYSAAADGLHLIASIENLSGAPVTLSFPTSARVAFVATRHGKTLWESTSNVRVLESKSRLTFEPHETKSFASLWPGYLTAGPEVIHIRSRLLVTPPVFAPTVDVAGVPLPTPPAVTPSPHPSATSAATAPAASATPAASAVPAASASPAVRQ